MSGKKKKKVLLIYDCNGTGKIGDCQYNEYNQGLTYNDDLLPLDEFIKDLVKLKRMKKYEDVKIFVGQDWDFAEAMREETDEEYQERIEKEECEKAKRQKNEKSKQERKRKRDLETLQRLQKEYGDLKKLENNS